MDGDLTLLRFVQVERIPLALVVVALAWIGMRAAAGFFDSLGERFPRRRLALKQASAALRFLVIFAVAVAVVTSVFQLTDQVVLAVGGSAAVAVGFAIKDLLSSLMAGVVLLFDRPFQVGDRVQFGGTYGEVVEIGLRTVRIATLDDNLVSVPNNLFLTEAVACANAGALDQMCVIDVWIPSGEDVERARRIVFEAAATSRYAHLEKPITVGVTEGTVPEARRVALRLATRVYVLDGRYELALGTDITLRARRALREAGIRTVGDVA